MDYMKEKEEAVRAGERALNSLKEARQQISGAKGLGIWDLLGGGSFVSFFKHMKVSRAREALSRAQYDLQSFNNELHDIQMNLNIDIGEFLTLFDLFDSFIADVIVQSRLADATRRIDDAIFKVEDCLRYLRTL